MWKGKKVSIVFPAYNEEGSIAIAVKDFLATGVVDEIIVVDNNSKDNTAELAKKAGARVIKETRQGYGWANRRGLKEAKGDIIITAEPDGTFIGRDIFKLLAYSEDFDFVGGTRTYRDLISKGAKMDWFLWIGNIALAKLVQVLFFTSPLSDVGCTMKLISRKGYEKIKNQFTVGDSPFSPEFMIITIKNKLSVIEVPVSYKKRVGESKITSDFYKSFKLGVVMIFLIFKYRFGLVKK